MNYEEDLPINCPPNGAEDKERTSVCRFLPYPEGDARNFYSHHKLGKKTGNAPECRAKSLSLFNSRGVQVVVAAKKTAFFKKMKICLMNIPRGAGKSIEDATGHIDLWMFADYDPSQSVVSVVDTVEELDQGLAHAK